MRVRTAGQDAPVRATQKLIAQMSFCSRHPSLTALEIGWRWLFGVPFLLIVQAQFNEILLRVPPESAGLNRLGFQNPWLSSSLLASAAEIYRPEAAHVLRWLAPAGVVIWAIVAGMGRTLVLSRLDRLSAEPARRRVASHIGGMILLQGAWIVLQLAVFCLWYSGVGWAAANHLGSATDPDLLGYLLWLIFFSLGLFTGWALTSWALAVAPILMLEEDRSAVSALVASFRLGKTLSSKLLEVNLVMAIVRIALIVLAMVFSAAPLPFADELGTGSLNVLYVVVAIFYLVGTDYFQVVRLKSFLDLRRVYRGERAAAPEN
jgi:hypothetical protein